MAFTTLSELLVKPTLGLEDEVAFGLSVKLYILSSCRIVYSNHIPTHSSLVGLATSSMCSVYIHTHVILFLAMFDEVRCYSTSVQA